MKTSESRGGVGVVDITTDWPLALTPMTPPTPMMTTTVHNEMNGTLSKLDRSRIFPFFRLPREIRDEIYYHALDFKYKLPSQHSARLRVRRRANINLLLASRQLRYEYAAIAQRHTTLIVVDRDEYLGQKLILPIPALNSAVMQLEVHLALACNDVCHTHIGGCRVKREMRMHRRWIADVVAQMRGLDRIVLNILLDPHDYVEHCEEILEAEQWRLAGLEVKTEMNVFHCAYETSAAAWNFMRRVPLYTWDHHRTQLKRLPLKKHQAEVEGPEVSTATAATNSASKVVVVSVILT